MPVHLRFIHWGFNMHNISINIKSFLSKHFSLIGVFTILTLVFLGCAKEYSEENSDPAQGSLAAADTGECLPKTLVGFYEVDKLLSPYVDYVEITLHVINKGTFSIQSDTLNGYYFSAAGVITDTGYVTVKLGANGTPLSEGTNTFTISFDSTQCSFDVVVDPKGTSSPAVYTFVGTGSPSSCSGAVPYGSYAVGQDLTVTNTVDLTVNVTQIGTYSITTTQVNGMIFTTNGRFTTTGVQTINLTASGTPLAVGNYIISVNNGAGSGCNFAVSVVTPSNYKLVCGTEVLNGFYLAGTPLNATNVLSMNITSTVPAIVNLTSNTVNGMTFTGTLNLAAAGTGSIIITGTGTPISPGVTPVIFSVGTSSCVVYIPVQ